MNPDRIANQIGRTVGYLLVVCILIVFAAAAIVGTTLAVRGLWRLL